MKPRRYPYSGKRKNPINLLMDLIKMSEKLNAVEFKIDEVAFNKRKIKTSSNIKPEEIPGYQEPVLRFDCRC